LIKRDFSVERIYQVLTNEFIKEHNLLELDTLILDFKVGDCIKHDGPWSVYDEITDIFVEDGTRFYNTISDQYVDVKFQHMYHKRESTK